MTLKDQIQSDINDIFLDIEDGMAEKYEVKLEGKVYCIPIVIDDEMTGTFPKTMDGIFQSSLTIHFAENAVKRKPVRGQLMVFDNKPYCVAECDNQLGMLKVKLEVPDVD